MASGLPSPDLKPAMPTQERFVQSRDHFAQLKDVGAAEVRYFWSGPNDEFIWQQVRFGNPLQKGDNNLFRGYLMIEPEDIPKALEILSKTGERSAQNGETLQFKWLMRLNSKNEDPIDLLVDESKIGSYEGLAPEDPRIAIYGDTVEDIQATLTSLATNPEWQAIEQHRRDKYGGKAENAPRRPGTNALIVGEEEYRSLNFNDKPGNSEGEAEDPEWRQGKAGSETVELEIPDESEENEYDLTAEDLALAGSIAIEGNPDFSHIILKAITYEGNLPEILRDDFTQFRKEGENNPLLTLLAIDLERASIQARVHDLSKMNEAPQGKLRKKAQPDVEKEAAKLSQRFDELKAERASFPGQPDQIVMLAAELGVEEEMLKMPIVGIREKLTQAIQDKAERQKLFEFLDKSGFPAKEDIKKYIGSEKMEENVKKYGKRAAMAGGAVGLLILLSGWFAMKMESGQRRQQ